MDIDHRSVNWHIRRGLETVGPIKWEDIVFMRKAGELDGRDHIRSELDDDWIQISDYPNFTTVFSEPDDISSAGLMPDGTDAIFLLGLLSFFAGAIAFFFNPLIGVGILVAALILEIGSIIYSFKFKPKAVGKTLGNIIAIIWACFQGVITFFFIFFMFV